MVARVLAVLVLGCTSIGLSLGASTDPVRAANLSNLSNMSNVAAFAGRAPVCAKTYTVVSGDFWFGIAKKVGVAVATLLKVNSATVATVIHPGDVLCLPDEATSPSTTVPVTSPPTATTTTVAGSGPVVPLSAFPVQGPCWFTNTWGAKRDGGRHHEGVDLIAKTGQYVYAVVDGTLWKQAWDTQGSRAGNAWWLRTADGSYYFYAHMSAFAPDLSIGSKVVAGQIIGWVGMTGNAAAPHLHFEIHPGGGAPIDPTPSVKAIDGCTNNVPPPQPSGTVPPAPGPSTTAVSGTTTVPPNTAPPNTAPASTVAAPPTSAGALWSFIAPVSAFDTAWTGSRVGAHKTTTINVGKLKGVLATTGGVMVRLTTRGAASGGYLVVHRCDVPAPAVASLTFPANGGVVGTTVAEVVDGKVCLTSNVSLGIKVEVIAFRSASGVGLQAVRSTRALDTRVTGTRLRPGTSVSIDPAKLGVVPGTQAVSATITMVSPSGAGTVSIGFCGSGLWSVPVSSDSLSSFSIAMRVTSTGWCLTSSVVTDVVVDVTGLWTGSNAPPSPINPVRVYDSRTAGAQVGPSAVAVAVAGQGGIPAGATTAMVSISTVTGGNPGIVFVGPCGQERSEGAAVVGAPKRIVTAVVPVLLGGGAVCISALQPVDVIVDVVGAA